MAKFIVFDGDFREAEVPWLEQMRSEEDWKEWLRRNKLRDFEDWSSHDEWDDMGPRQLSVYAHVEGRKWLVLCSSGGSGIDFVIEGDVNYLKFLASPMCCTISLHENMASLRATVQAAFTVWHGHRPPDSMSDHDVTTTCSDCDPGFDETRELQRKKIREGAVERRKAAERKAGSVS
jgi:hypothetical protein